MAYFGMGGNWNSRARYLSCYPQYTFCLVWLDTVIQNHEQTIARITRSMACMAAGFYIAAYVNDVMQYPNSIPVYTAFALCFTGPYIDKRMRKDKIVESETNNKS